MERFGAQEWNFDWSRRGGWVEFRIDGQLYRFDHSVDKANANGQKIQYGSDAFAQLVLALEDLARLAERGIYKLQTWIEGMRYLPPPIELPECFRDMGFSSLPADVAAINDRYRALAKRNHPDVVKDDGTAFKNLQRAAEEARRYLEESDLRK
ncbi:J domain-containing protein [Xylanibacillus composti]|nr:J domain-containing protein [Xylanibacillus composti]